ncbi:MAG: permease-like cell division protein FtsX [Bacteroidaceae bacterium]|nr:permease-like cell division protein FtsX [Bacteroidaceae bacterium]
MKRPIFKVQTLSVYISTTLVLLLLGVMGIMLVAATGVSKEIHNNLEVSVIINSDTEETDILKLKERLGKERYIQDITYISKEQALEEQKAELGADPVEQLGYNPYEAELCLTLQPQYANSDSLQTIEDKLLRNKNIKEVIYQKDLMNSVNESLKKAGAAMLLFLVLLTIISWSLISNMVRLSIYSKRFLLHTMKLTGATWNFIRKPFIISNIWIGFFSGIMANALLGVSLYLLLDRMPALTHYLPLEGVAVVGAAVMLFGIIICSLCAFRSVNRFLRMRNNDLYFI